MGAPACRACSGLVGSTKDVKSSRPVRHRLCTLARNTIVDSVYSCRLFKQSTSLPCGRVGPNFSRGCTGGLPWCRHDRSLGPPSARDHAQLDGDNVQHRHRCSLPAQRPAHVRAPRHESLVLLHKLDPCNTISHTSAGLRRCQRCCLALFVPVVVSGRHRGLGH